MTTPARTRRRARALAAASAAACAVVLTGCSGESGGGGGRDVAYVAGDGSYRVLAEDERREPVRLAATTLDGERLDLATLRGKPVVVNVWASWCKPCRAEAPELREAAKELAPDVAFVGVNSRDQQAAATAFERKFAVGYPSIVDTGPELLAFGGAIPPSSFPTTLVLDERGRVAARFTGEITKRTLVGLVDDVRGGDPA